MDGRRASEQEEPVLVRVQVPHRTEHPGAQVEGQQELVPLEQRPASEAVHGESMKLVQILCVKAITLQMSRQRECLLHLCPRAAGRQH